MEVGRNVDEANFEAAKRPLILLTNDDGLDSPGLLAAAVALAGLGDLLIVAPAEQQTAMARSSPRNDGKVTERELLLPGGDRVKAIAISGSPAQAVLYATLVAAPRPPQLVVSGINYGENLGSSTTTSGTVGAALEAGALGIPALAVSLETDKLYHYLHGEDVDWTVAAAVTRKFARAALRAPLPFDVDVLKIDVPGNATAETPWRMTRQSRQPYYVTFLPEAGEHLDYKVEVGWELVEPDSDVQAFAADRVISVTPLSIDLTSRAARGGRTCPASDRGRI